MSVFEKINLNAAREEFETFENYKKRLSLNDKILRWYKKGQLIYSPLEKVKVPIVDKQGNLQKDESGNPQFYDKELPVGPYRIKWFGPLSEFGRKKREYEASKNTETPENK